MKSEKFSLAENIFLALLAGAGIYALLVVAGNVHAEEFPADAITKTDTVPNDGSVTYLINDITGKYTILDAQLKGTYYNGDPQYDSLAYINCESTDLASPINLVFGTPENYAYEPGKTHYFSGHTEGNMICGRVNDANPPADVALAVGNDGGYGVTSYSITYVPRLLASSTNETTTPMTVDIPLLNIYNGLILFLLMFFGFIYYFK